MHDYLKKKFKHDPQKPYYMIDEIKTAEFCKIKKEKIKTAGSSRLHMLSLTPECVQTKKSVLTLAEEGIINLEFSAEYTDNHSVENDDKDDEPEIDIEKDGDQIKNSTLKFEFVNPLSDVGLRPPSNSFELFYLCKIVSKHIADKNITDNYGHSICHGDHYFIVTY